MEMLGPDEDLVWARAMRVLERSDVAKSCRVAPFRPESTCLAQLLFHLSLRKIPLWLVGGNDPASLGGRPETRVSRAPPGLVI